MQGRAADETNNQILALKVHTEKENNEFENQLQTLQNQLNQRDDAEEHNYEEEKEEDDIKKMNKNTEFANPIEITNRKMERGKARNEEKKRLYE